MPFGLRRSIPLTIASVLLASSVLSGRAQEPVVRVDPRFELVSIVFHLTGNPDYNMGQVPEYVRAVTGHFGAAADHEAVVRARELSRAHGLFFDRPAQLAPLLTEPPRIALRAPLGDSGLRLSDMWPRDRIPEFVGLLDRFARDTRFVDFFKGQQRLYAEAERRLREILTRDIDLSWYRRFYGAAPDADFMLVPAPLIGGGNYSVSFTPAGRRGELWAVIGVSGIDSAGRPAFNEGVPAVIVHEYNHSFVGPLVDAWMSKLEGPARVLTAAMKEELERWGYGLPSTTVHESLVRAATVVYFEGRGDPARAREVLLEDERRGFLWEHALVDLLHEYDAARSTYPTFERFMPRVAAFLETTAARLPAIVAEYDSRRPRVVLTSPSLDQPLAAGDTEITLTFDQPMRESRQVTRQPDLPNAFPRVTGSHWNPDRTQLTIALTLQPGREYALRVIDAASAAGVLLKAYPIRFRTRAP